MRPSGREVSMPPSLILYQSEQPLRLCPCHDVVCSQRPSQQVKVSLLNSLMVYGLWGVLGCFIYLANTNYLFRKVRNLLDYPWMRQNKTVRTEMEPEFILIRKACVMKYAQHLA